MDDKDSLSSSSLSSSFVPFLSLVIELYRFISSILFPLSSSLQHLFFNQTTSRHFSISISSLPLPLPLPAGYLSWKRVLSRLSIFFASFATFRIPRIRCEFGRTTRLSSTNLSTDITTDITTVHSPHDTSRHTIYRPALLNGQEEGEGGRGRGVATAFNQVLNRIALFGRISKRHGVNWKLVSLLIHGGVPWYRKKLPSALLAPSHPLFQTFSFRAKSARG